MEGSTQEGEALVDSEHGPCGRPFQGGEEM